MPRLPALAFLLVAIGTPANAATYVYNLSGTITTVEGNAVGSDIVVGDAISGNFTFDDSSLGLGAVVAGGGGTRTIYSATFTQFQLNIGTYHAAYGSFAGSLGYGDNVFGQDDIVFLFDGLPGGPFGSTFGNFQLQARGPTTAINSSGAANGLPLERFETSFFGGFSNGATAERVYGTLTMSAVPEPATWTMIMLGVGLVGFQMRRRRGLAISHA